VLHEVRISVKYEELLLRQSDRRFELEVEGHTAFINYKLSGNALTLIHTEVPPELGGKGVAAAIVEKALAFAKEKGYKIVPLCPYVQTYLKRHPEWNEIVENNVL
jgi:uncharacterized protein